jgi:hypothetical protein
MPVKADKAKLLHQFGDTESTTTEHSPVHNTAAIIDGKALLHCIVDLPETFEELCEQYVLDSSKMQRSRLCN